MTRISHLSLCPMHRHGSGEPGGLTRTERWAWDFTVDGRALSAVIGGDVVGALGWGDAVWEAGVRDKLLGRAAPDLPPNRVALYVCPECGDLGCGAVTAAVTRHGDTVVWQDFRWERDWGDGELDDDVPGVGPFRFEAATYDQLLHAAARVRPELGVAPLTAS